MFPIDAISGLAQGMPAYRLLKPWWDVLTDYLAVAMLVTSLVAGTMQVSTGGVVCVPAVDCTSENKYINAAAKNICSTYETNYTGMKPIRTLKLADRGHYDFVNAECGANAVHFFPSYFPFIIFLEAVVLLVIDNFWLQFPKTASVVESFIALVLECHNSQGTCVDLSDPILRTQMKNDNTRSGPRRRFQEPADVEAQTNLLDDTNGRQDDGDSTSSHKYVKEDYDSPLDVTEALKAKTLYEKVRRFRATTEPYMSVSLVYIIQVIMQVLTSLIFFGIDLHVVLDKNIINSVVNCTTDELISVDHKFFRCLNALAPFYENALVFFCFLLGLYFIACICAYVWLVSRVIQCGDRSKCSKCFYVFEMFSECFRCVFVMFSKCLKCLNCQCGIRKYYFQQGTDTIQETTAGGETLRSPVDILPDIPPAKKDLAFLLHLLDESNKLFRVRFFVFLSDTNEKKLKRLILERQWPLHILEEYLDHTEMELKLSQLTDIPATVFRMFEICRLTLKDCKLLIEEFPSAEDFLKLVNLKSLSLVNCGLTAIPKAIFKLRYLKELNLSRNEIPRIPDIGELEKLRTLDISYNRVQEFEAVTKKLPLAALNMQYCDLTSIPKAVFEVDSLQTLNLSHNNIESIPQDVQKLNLLENLDISYNPLAKECFDSIALCPKLQRVFTEKNIESLPPDIPINLKVIIKGTKFGVHVTKFPTEKAKNMELSYKMTSKPKGLAIIIINAQFRDFESDTSEGSELNGNKLEALFEQIGFKVLCYKNRSKSQITDLLTSVPDKYSECDSFVSFIESSGNEQGIFCSDSTYDEPEILGVDQIVRTVGEKSTYKGKPKMFFFHVRREDLTDGDFSRPIHNNMFIGYFRSSPLFPKMFLSAFLDVFAKHAWEEDVLSLLSYADRGGGCNSEDFAKHTSKSQFPTYKTKSTLKKKLYLLPGFFGPIP